jgi:lipopolysaccharide biosynthesis protein
MKTIRAIVISWVKRCARWCMRVALRLGALRFLPKDPRVVESHDGLKTGKRTRLCIFASYSRTGEVEDYVFHNLKQLQASGFDTIFVTTAAGIPEKDLQRLRKLCIRILRRDNAGYDFGSWKAGIFHAGIDIKTYDQLLVTNDSYYGPIFSWKKVLAQAHSDLYGITDSYGVRYHLMSYFVLYNKRILHSPAFLRCWQDVRMIPTILKTLVIYAYEVGMSQKFQRDGFSVAAYCPEKKLFDKLPAQRNLLGKTIIVHRFWKELIELMHCPILKVDTFWRVLNPAGDKTWLHVLKKAGYDTRLIRRHQEKLAARAKSN